MPHVEAGEGPAPCDTVDLAGGEDKGVAMLKDIVGVAQYLAIPTQKLTGIEEAYLLTPEAPNYFAEAWAERGLLDAKLGVALPREAVSMAINSEYARTQDQLHLHIDCLRPDVMATLTADAKTFDDTWRPMVEPLNGRIYFARRLLSADLSDARPFQLLADGLEGARRRCPIKLWRSSAPTLTANRASSCLPTTPNWPRAARRKPSRTTPARSRRNEARRAPA